MLSEGMEKEKKLVRNGLKRLMHVVKDTIISNSS